MSDRVVQMMTDLKTLVHKARHNLFTHMAGGGRIVTAARTK